MTSWSQLIQKIQQLCDAFEEDLASSCCQLSDEQAASLSEEVTTAPSPVQLMSPRLSCYDVTVEPRLKQMKCQSSRLTVPPSADLSTSVQKMKPLKSKLDHHLQKKYKYVNKKFILCKEARNNERDTELLDKETHERSAVHDPFEFVGSQMTRASDDCAVLFADELRDIQQPIIASRCTAVQRKCRRQQHRLMDSGLKQLVEDIADAESYSLVVSQRCSMQSDNRKQVSTVHGSSVAGTSGITNEVCDDATEPDVGVVCVPERQSELMSVELDAETDERAAECEKQCHVISVKLNVEAEQLHSAPAASTHRVLLTSAAADATDNREIRETSVRRSADTAQTELCAVDRAELAHSVDVSSACMTHDVSDTSADVTRPLSTSITTTALSVLDETQHRIAHSKPLTAATVAAPVTLHHDTSDGHVSLPSMSLDGSDEIKVKKSYKRCHKALQKKQKTEKVCYAGSGLRKVKRKAARLIVVDVEDDSSG